MRKKRKNSRNEVALKEQQQPQEKSLESFDDEILLLILNATNNSGKPLLSANDMKNFTSTNRNLRRVSNHAFCFFHQKSYGHVRNAYLEHKSKFINAMDNNQKTARELEKIRNEYFDCTMGGVAIGTTVSAIKYDCSPLPTAGVILSLCLILNLMNYGIEQYTIFSMENELNQLINNRFNSVPLYLQDELTEQNIIKPARMNM